MKLVVLGMGHSGSKLNYAGNGELQDSYRFESFRNCTTEI